MDYEKLLKYRMEHNHFARLLGVSLTEISLGAAKGMVQTRPEHINPIGSVHGGCMFTLADIVGAAAASSYGEQITTLDSTIHYLKAGLNSTCIYADAQVLKHGKRITVVEVSITDQDGELLSSVTLTFMSLGKPVTGYLE